MANTNYLELKAANAELNLNEYRQGNVILRSMPRYVMVELTQGCNLRCPMCRSKAIGFRERVLDRRVLSKVADMLFPAAQMVDIRGWGESLVTADIADIIDLVNSYQARCRVVTNLSFNRPDILDLLVDSKSMIDFSLDAADQATLDICRPGARLSLITQNARRITSRVQACGGDLGSVRIITTLQSVTLEQVPRLVGWASEVGVRSIVLNEVTLAPGDPLAVKEIPEQVNIAVSRAREVASEVGVDLFAGTALGNCVGVTKSAEWCLHPWAYATLGYDGSVGYCDHLIGPMMQYSCMGEITKTSFMQIWNGRPWQELRLWHASRERVREPQYGACFACYKHRNVDFEDIFEPRLKRHSLG